MVSISRFIPRTPYKTRFGTTKNRQPLFKAHDRLISLLFGRAPEDARPEVIEEATKWLDSVAGKIDSDLPAENG